MSFVNATASRKNQRFQPDTGIEMNGFSGLNLFDPHMKLGLSEFKALTNWDIYSSYLKVRNGSASLTDITSKLGATENVLGGLEKSWDLGADEYMIIQTQGATTSNLKYIKLDGTGTFTTVKQWGSPGSAAATLANNVQAKFVLAGNRVLIAHSSGCKVIEWRNSQFEMRTLGMPTIDMVAATANGAGILTGKYTYGVELIQKDPVTGDITCAGTPRRRTSAAEIITGTYSANTVAVSIGTPSGFTIDGGGLLQDGGVNENSFWTHIRIYRSKRQDSDFTNPSDPVSGIGSTAELYFLAEITRAAVDNVVAPFKYVDNIPDGKLPDRDIWTINKIELSPMPAALLLAHHKGRVWLGRVDTIDPTKSRLWPSYDGDYKYFEQYDPQNFVDCQIGDGAAITEIVSFERDLIVLKDDKTGRIQDGNPDFGWEMLDASIGVTDRRLVKFVPKMGLVGITSDGGEGRVFGYDNRWGNAIEGIEFARSLRNETTVMKSAPSYVSLVYANGRLFISDGTGLIYALNSKEGRSWSLHSYPMNSSCQHVFTYNGGTRLAVASKNTYIVQIDKISTTTDISTANDSSADISWTMTTPQFQYDGGRSLIEHDYLSIIGGLGSAFSGTAYVNGIPYPNNVATAEYFIPDPAVFPSPYTGMASREYQLFPETNPIGNFLHYVITGSGAATIQSIRLMCWIDTTVTAGFDPFSLLEFNPPVPAWNGASILYLKFDANSTTQIDSSGNVRTHTYVAGSGSRAHASTPLGGSESFTGGSGSELARTAWTDSFTVNDAGFPNDEVFEAVGIFSSLASLVVIAEGPGSTASSFYRISVNTDGSLQFTCYTFNISAANVVNYKWTTAAGAITAGTDIYTIQFALTGNGQNGQFYYGISSAAMSTPTTTRAAFL